jgi:hypothetical protein
MKIMEPVEDIGEVLGNFPKLSGESGQPQELKDEPAKVAQLLGRQNVTYEHIWEAAQKAYPKWLPVACNSYRRGLLLASSAVQHRTKGFEVKRRGRLVCLRYLGEPTKQHPVAVNG